MNKIPYYNEHYEDPEYMEEKQMHSARENYGTKDQDFIIDGSGVYITRNGNYFFGQFELSNNECYNNGINGLVVHKTNRVLVHNNKIYNNGKVSKEPPISRQSYAGLALNTANDVTLYNNYVTTELAEDFAFILHKSTFNEEESKDNFACVGKITAEFGNRVSQMGEGCENLI